MDLSQPPPESHTTLGGFFVSIRPPMTKTDAPSYTESSRRHLFPSAAQMMERSFFMHSENSKNASQRRANDEFLRRMLGGELGMAEEGRRPSCPLPSCRMGGAPTTRMPRREPSAPPCNDGDHAHSCPRGIHAPALAMVYSPLQCWEGLLPPEKALKAGSQFSALILPLEAGAKRKESEVCNRRCNL